MSDSTHNEKIVRLGRQISDATIFMHEAIARKAGLAATDHKYLNLIVDSGKITAGELTYRSYDWSCNRFGRQAREKKTCQKRV